MRRHAAESGQISPEKGTKTDKAEAPPLAAVAQKQSIQQAEATATREVEVPQTEARSESKRMKSDLDQPVEQVASETDELDTIKCASGYSQSAKMKVVKVDASMQTVDSIRTGSIEPEPYGQEHDVTTQVASVQVDNNHELTELKIKLATAEKQMHEQLAAARQAGQLHARERERAEAALAEANERASERESQASSTLEAEEVSTLRQELVAAQEARERAEVAVAEANERMSERESQLTWGEREMATLEEEAARAEVVTDELKKLHATELAAAQQAGQLHARERERAEAALAANERMSEQESQLTSAAARMEELLTAAKNEARTEMDLQARLSKARLSSPHLLKNLKRTYIVSYKHGIRHHTYLTECSYYIKKLTIGDCFF